MKLSKYFLTIFTFVLAASGAISAALDSFDFIVTSDGNFEAINSLGPHCDRFNNGLVCLAVTLNGTFVATYSTFAEAQWARLGLSGDEQRTK